MLTTVARKSFAAPLVFSINMSEKCKNADLCKNAE
jgi:hypothetical protein